MRYPPATLPTLLISTLYGATAVAGEVDVIGGTVDCGATGCTISATLRHADTGWNHYADHWRVLTPDGQELGRRVLHHPHVDEQPFTRSLGRVSVPTALEYLLLEAHDSVHGYGGKRFRLELP